MSYAFIGDVHSQSEPLKKALGYCAKKGLTPILLGDIFDSQCLTSNSVETLELIQQAQADLGAIVLRSNHQVLLERLAKKEEVPLKKDFCKTVREFQEAAISLESVAAWLETFPYAVALRVNGKEYRAAHAEIPESVHSKVPSNYDGVWQFFDPDEEEHRRLLWGADYSLSDKERFWWLGKKQQDWVSVAGHYHRVVNKKHALVLDAGCGGKTRTWYDKRLPLLLLYDTSEEKLEQFECFTAG